MDVDALEARDLEFARAFDDAQFGLKPDRKKRAVAKRPASQVVTPMKAMKVVTPMKTPMKVAAMKVVTPVKTTAVVTPMKTTAAMKVVTPMKRTDAVNKYKSTKTNRVHSGAYRKSFTKAKGSWKSFAKSKEIAKKVGRAAAAASSG